MDYEIFFISVMLREGCNEIESITLLALITPALNGVIFFDMALKRPALYVCQCEFDHVHLKNTANKGRR